MHIKRASFVKKESFNFEYVEKVVPSSFIKKQGKDEWIKVVYELFKQLELEFNHMVVEESTQ